jgi:hypothetical protein
MMEFEEPVAAPAVRASDRDLPLHAARRQRGSNGSATAAEARAAGAPMAGDEGGVAGGPALERDGLRKRVRVLSAGCRPLVPGTSSRVAPDRCHTTRRPLGSQLPSGDAYLTSSSRRWRRSCRPGREPGPYTKGPASAGSLPGEDPDDPVSSGTRLRRSGRPSTAGRPSHAGRCCSPRPVSAHRIGSGDLQNLECAGHIAPEGFDGARTCGSAPYFHRWCVGG